MFWETLWALVLGFSLSGAVQAFVSKAQMQRALGDHGPASVARAAGYGVVSSSCSYAASAMTKSLFQKGADIVAAVVFMVASTNLVVELGIVLLVLLGWQFLAAEFVGGPIMIVLLALLGGFVLRGPLVDAARARLEGRRADARDDPRCAAPEDDQAMLDATPLRAKLRAAGGWSDAASYAVADATMLRRELAIGYLVAGFLAALVPAGFWTALFVRGHGGWTILENALVGPVIAFLSWVCSVGNVPLAAALWHGGISFGGVVAFVFADLLSAPIVLIYRKYYGGALTMRLVAALYGAIVLASLAVELIFAGAHIAPTSRTLGVSAAHFSWNYTTFLNIAACALAGALYYLHRSRARLGGGAGYAIDPVCGMQVRTADAPARTLVGGTAVYFCSDRCRARYEADPDRFARDAGQPAGGAAGGERAAEATAIDPVCGMTVDPASAITRRIGGRDLSFCCTGCAQRYEEALGGTR